MSKSVTGRERQPVRSPLGQSHLQAVEVGTNIVRRPVDEAKVREAGKVGPGFLRGLAIEWLRGRSRSEFTGVSNLRRRQRRILTPPRAQRRLIDVPNAKQS